MHKECLDGDRIFVIHDFLTPAECRSFLERSEQEGYHEATITTPAGSVMDKEVRDNARLIVDDAVMASELWAAAAKRNSTATNTNCV